MKQQPPVPEEDIDRLADEVEIGRLMEMKVLVKPIDPLITMGEWKATSPVAHE